MRPKRPKTGKNIVESDLFRSMVRRGRGIGFDSTPVSKTEETDKPRLKLRVKMRKKRQQNER